MGIDLIVMASHFRDKLTGPSERREFLPTASLRLERDPVLFGHLRLAAAPIPDGLDVGFYGDAGLVWIRQDAYTRPLAFTTSEKVRQISCAHRLDPWNEAILDFLRALPVDKKIILYWC